MVTGLIGVLEHSLNFRAAGFDLVPEQNSMIHVGVPSPCAAAMGMLLRLAESGGDAAAVLLRSSDEGATVARAAVALLRAGQGGVGGTLHLDDSDALDAAFISPCAVLLGMLACCGATVEGAAAAAAAPALAPLFSELDVAAAVLAGAAASACRALRTAIASGRPRGAAPGAFERSLAQRPLACLLSLLKSAAAAAGAARPPIKAATARAVLGAAAAAIALTPPGEGVPPGMLVPPAQEILVRARALRVMAQRAPLLEHASRRPLQDGPFPGSCTARLHQPSIKLPPLPGLRHV